MEKTHISCYYPDLPPSPFDHVVSGEDKSAKKAFAQAKRYLNRLKPTDQLIFIESTDAPASIKFDCPVCDSRSPRQDHLLR